jgi:hypothetical protein
MKLVLKCKQWTLEVEGDSPAFNALAAAANGQPVEISDYRMFNPDAAGNHQFYEVVQLDLRYGNPGINQEPFRGILLPQNMSCIDVGGTICAPPKDDRLVGIILKNSGGAVIRGSLTNLASKNLQYGLNPDGSFQFQNVRFLLRTLFAPDKNRLKGWVGFGRPDTELPALPTRLVEMGDLDLTRA